MPLIADDGDGEDWFGVSVALSADGTTALIGAESDEDPNGEMAGSAYVFTIDGEEWTQQAKLAADDGDAEDNFGNSVALSADGTTALIGSFGDEDPYGDRAGSTYVFTSDGGKWSQQAKLVAEDGDPQDGFGGAVALSADGETALIGANTDEDPNGDTAGSAYVFTSDDSEWSQQAKLVAEDGNEADHFGNAVALSADGTTALLGALRDEDRGVNAGSAYVFTDDGEWSQQAKLVAEDGDDQDFFGYSVALSADGTTALIGAFADEDPNGAMAGSAYVFAIDGEWNQQAKLVADDGNMGDIFGSSVALSNGGTTALIGAAADDDPNGDRSGSAYVFSDDGEWNQQAKLVADDKRKDFGGAVALSADGRPALIGASGYPNGENIGSAYVFE